MAKKKTSLNRRKFLSKGLAGIAAAMTFPYCKQQEKAQETTEEKNGRPFIYRTLGKTGIKLPVISMGTMDETSEALVRTALDAGIAHIATSQAYLRGRVEEFIGKVIKHYKREDIFLATSVIPQPMDFRTGTFSKDTDIPKYEKAFEGSLKRLGVDYIDIFYLPFAAGEHSVTFEPIMKAMDKFKKDGKTRFLGIASHNSTAESVRAAADTGFYDFAMPAYNSQFKNIEELNESISYAAGKGMGIIAMKTIAGNSWRKSGEEKTGSNPKAALKWVLQNKNIHSTVPGFTTFDQLETDLSVMEDLTLTSEEKAYLELAHLNHKDGLFCQGCGTCLKQCPSAPDIPTLMRTYMYVYGYRNLVAAARNIESVRDDPIACTDCSSCVVNCPMGFDIKEKVLDIIRLKDIPTEFFA